MSYQKTPNYFWLDVDNVNHSHNQNLNFKNLKPNQKIKTIDLGDEIRFARVKSNHKDIVVHQFMALVIFLSTATLVVLSQF
jgi:hypothetical protein